MSEDLISRQSAIDALMTILDKPNHAEFLYTDEICNVLNELPSAQPEHHAENLLAYAHDMGVSVEQAEKELQVAQDDLISRQDAINAIKYWGLIDGLSEGQAVEILEDEEKLPSAQPEIIRCKNCKHRPKRLEEGKGEGFNLEFPDYKCPCQCDDGWYNWMPDDNWFCATAERKES